MIVATVTAIAALGAAAVFAETPSAGDAALFERLDADGNGIVSSDELSSDHKRLFARLLQRADANEDNALSRDEFLAALVPSRPEKRIEAKQPAIFPQADAVRYLLLTMDTNGNSWIEADEVSHDLRPVFDAMAERLDRNRNDVLETIELGRAGGPLARIAGRYVAREKIDVAGELMRLEKSQGKAAHRFDEPPGPLIDHLRDPKQARNIFTRLDGNGDGQIEPKEVPEPLQRQIQRITRLSDRDRDGNLSEREFLAGAERISRIMARRGGGQMPDRDANPKRRSRQTDSLPADET